MNLLLNFTTLKGIKINDKSAIKLAFSLLYM